MIRAHTNIYSSNIVNFPTYREDKVILDLLYISNKDKFDYEYDLPGLLPEQNLHLAVISQAIYIYINRPVRDGEFVSANIYIYGEDSNFQTQCEYCFYDRADLFIEYVRCNAIQKRLYNEMNDCFNNRFISYTDLFSTRNMDKRSRNYANKSTT